MGLAADSSHDPVRIKGQIPNRVDSFFFGLAILAHRRTVRPGQWCVSDQIEIGLSATRYDSHAGWNAIAALGLDVPQDRLAFEAVQALPHEQANPSFFKISSYPRSRFWIQITI